MAEIIGIDFGAQLSGNSVIAHLTNNEVQLIQVAKKQHTDSWLKDMVEEIKLFKGALRPNIKYI